jgi:hypothetical protein
MSESKELLVTEEEGTFTMDHDKYLKELKIKSDFLTKCVKDLRGKIHRQGDTPTYVDCIAKVHMFLESLDRACESAEVAMASLDKVGDWKLSDEDIERINAEDETSKMFKTFLPHMLAYHLATTEDKSQKGYKGNCVAL